MTVHFPHRILPPERVLQQTWFLCGIHCLKSSLVSGIEPGEVNLTCHIGCPPEVASVQLH